ncbi:MAG: hypothetical protein AAGE52_39020 [Myxococcota bacterium]
MGALCLVIACGGDDDADLDAGTLDGAVVDVDGAVDASSEDASRSDAGGLDGGARDGGERDAGDRDGGPGPDAAPGDLMILEAGASRARITEGETVRFTALVTHADGPDAILGGSLIDAGGTTLASFRNAGPGSFETEVSWEEIHGAESIEFDEPIDRSFRVRFFDMAGGMAERSVSLEFHCDDNAACDGQCIDLQSDPDNCGMCRRSCAIGETVTGCAQGSCVALASTRRRESCATTCARRGYGCANLCQFTTNCSRGCNGPDLSSYRDQDNFSEHRPGDEAGFFSFYFLGSRTGNNWLTRDTLSCDAVPAAELGAYDHDVTVCCCETTAEAGAPLIASTSLAEVPHGVGFTIDGGFFDDATAVQIGGTSVPFEIVSGSRIQVTEVVDAVPTGEQPVVVVGPGGMSNERMVEVFHLVISEVDALADEEFIEISSGLPERVLRGLVLITFNGATDQVERAIQLSGGIATRTRSDGRLLIGNIAGADIEMPDNTVQNGPDGAGIFLGLASDFPRGAAIPSGAIDAVVWDTDDPDARVLLRELLGTGPEAVQINESSNGNPVRDSVQRCSETRLDGRGWRVAASTPGANNRCP